MNKLDISVFFPVNMLQITEMKQTEKTIHIYLKSKARSCNCHQCGQLTEQYQVTYVSNVQKQAVKGACGYVKYLE